jgi:AraC-like DNA-binding protein
MHDPDPPLRPELTLATAAGRSPVQGFFDAVAPIFTGNLVEAAQNTAHETRLHGVQLGPLVISQARMTGGVFTYARDAQLIARSGMDLIFVQIITRGHDLRLVGGREVRSTPGDVFVADLTRPMRTQTSDCDNFSFVLPRASFGLSEAELDGLHDRILPAHSAAAQVILGHVRMLWSQRQTIAPTEAAGLTQGTAGLLAGLLRGQPAAGPEGAPEANPVRYLQICQFIDANLEAPDLGPDLLAARFGLSRAALYRMFAGQEGVAGHIRDRRLRRAFRMLTAPGRVAVAQVGFACGFQSPSGFSRAFRARFGITPGEAQEAASLRALRQVTQEGALLRSWLELARLATPG